MILDVASESLIHARGTVRLSRTQTLLLDAIAARYPGAASRQEVEVAAWPARHPKFRSALDTQIRRLRDAVWCIDLEIEPEKGIGYRITQPIVVIRDWRNVGAIVPRDAVADLYAVLDLSQSKKRAQRLRAAIEVVG